ncbi:outer membrane beta-barrel protein [Dyadobacter sp. 676]|uniref:Outer membrane beta-barrel protein n=1 Tax=Dyadobacter sp. 676 TaxID=3088362 RepID=A0AAU8FSG1_9BACT
MDPSNINNFEDQWKKALQEASETPPPSVWEGIEAHLDREQEKVVPLWWRSPRMWYAAASIAVLLLVGGGLWFSGGTTDNKPHVAVTMKPAREADEKNTGSVNEAPVVIEIQETEKLASGDGANVPSRHKAASSETLSKAGAGANAGAVAKKSRAASDEPHAEQVHIASTNVPQKPAVSSGSDNIVNTAEPVTQNSLPEQVASAEVGGSGNAARSENRSISVELLATLPYNDLDVYVQKRHVFFRPEIQVEEPVKPKKQKEYYAGIGIMPASFNPDVQLKEAPTAFLAQSVSQKRAVTGSNEARASYAVQTQGGVRLSKHWSLETGLSYLRGNSNYEGGGYVLSAYNSAAANVLENALAANSPALADKTASFNNGALYIDVAKKVRNNYQYLQLPVQAGFTLNPDKKLSYSVLGGMMANFFLVNELESASGDIIRTTASDEIYRGMNWAATTGLRFNYKFSAKWGANLTGSYQKAVSSGFRANQSLDSHPYLYGVSWSVRYSF